MGLRLQMAESNLLLVGVRTAEALMDPALPDANLNQFTHK